MYKIYGYKLRKLWYYYKARVIMCIVIVIFYKEEDKIMRKSFKKVITAVMAMALTLAAVPGVALADESSDEAIAAGKVAFDASGNTEYHGYLLFQVDQSWVFRDSWTNPNTGRSYENFDKVLTTLNVDDPVVVDGTITDAVIKGNGTYTVKAEGLNGCGSAAAPTAAVKVLGVSTDIPSSSNIKITNVKTKIDNMTSKEQAEAILDDEEDARSKTMTVLCANLYRGTEDLSTEFKVPTNSIEVTFTVSGFDVDNPDAVEATPTPAKTESNSSNNKDDSGISTPVVVGIIVVAVVVIGAVVIVVKKKKK